MTSNSKSQLPVDLVRVISMILLLAATGCATTSTLPEVLTPVELVHQGVVSGSIAFVEKESGPFSSAWSSDQVIRLKDLRTQKVQPLPIVRTKDTNRYFVGNGCWGVPFAQALAPGRYSFVGWNRSQSVPGGTMHMSADFDFPFEVTAGQLLYLGEIKIGINPTEVVQASFWNTKTSDSINLECSDHSRRDLRMLKTLYPTVDWDKAKVDLSLWRDAPQTTTILAAPEWARGTSYEPMMKWLSPVKERVPVDQASQH